MQLGPKPTSIYTKAQFEDYQKRMIKTLFEKGLAAHEIVNNSEYKTFVTNWVDTEVTQKETQLKLLGKVRRLSNMFVTAPNNQVEINYPIIHEYKGHDLIKSFFFTLKEGKISIDSVEVIPGSSGILLIK